MLPPATSTQPEMTTEGGLPVGRKSMVMHHTGLLIPFLAHRYLQINYIPGQGKIGENHFLSNSGKGFAFSSYIGDQYLFMAGLYLFFAHVFFCKYRALNRIRKGEAISILVNDFPKWEGKILVNRKKCFDNERFILMAWFWLSL